MKLQFNLKSNVGHEKICAISQHIGLAKSHVTDRG